MPSLANAALYTIDNAQSSLAFTWSYAGLTDETAAVQSMHGTVHLNEAEPEQSDVDVTIQVADIIADDESTQALLKGESFFDVARFPTIHFVSDQIVQLDNASDVTRDQMSGQLTMHGVTRPVTLDITVSPQDLGALRAGHKTSLTLNAQTTLNRTDFKMTDYAGFVADNVSISMVVHLKKITPHATPAANAHK